MSSGCLTHGDDERLLSDLSRSPPKILAYSNDGTFFEGRHRLGGLLGHDLKNFLSEVALVIYRPEAVRCGKLVQANSHFEAASLVPFFAVKQAITAPMYHAMTRYQIQNATVDRIQLGTEIDAKMTSMVVLYRSNTAQPRPASITAKYVKGSTLFEDRLPGDLRTILGSPNTLSKFVHTSDEPADVLRELAILLDNAQTEDAVRSYFFAGNRAQSVRELMREIDLISDTPDVHPDRGMNAIIEAIQTYSGYDDDQKNSVTSYIYDIVDGKRRDFLSQLIKLMNDLRIDPIFCFMFAAEYIDRDVDWGVVEVPSVDPRIWGRSHVECY